MSTTSSSSQSISSIKDRGPASSSFDHRENMPPDTVDEPSKVVSWRMPPRVYAKKLLTSQSFGATHQVSSYIQSTQSVFMSAESLPDTSDDTVSQSVRDAFIPPRHNFVKKEETERSEGAAKKTFIKPSGIIFELSQYDIVCGYGAPSFDNKGNQLFRKMVEDHQAPYLCSKRADKPKIAIQIMDEIRARGGRYLRRVKIKIASNGRSFGWEEVAEKRFYEKVCQALREGAPEIRRKMLSCTKIREDTRRGHEMTPESPFPIFLGGGYSCRQNDF